MPPKRYSRHELTTAIANSSGTRLLTDRVPFRYTERVDNFRHTVAASDSLFTLAGRYYKGFTKRPSGFWWVIADFQPDPILDPTLVLDEGRIIFIPSERTLREEILNPKRRILF